MKQISNIEHPIQNFDFGIKFPFNSPFCIMTIFQKIDSGKGGQRRGKKNKHPNLLSTLQGGWHPLGTGCGKAKSDLGAGYCPPGWHGRTGILDTARPDDTVGRGYWVLACWQLIIDYSILPARLSHSLQNEIFRAGRRGYFVFDLWIYLIFVFCSLEFCSCKSNNLKHLPLTLRSGYSPPEWLSRAGSLTGRRNSCCCKFWSTNKNWMKKFPRLLLIRRGGWVLKQTLIWNVLMQDEVGVVGLLAIDYWIFDIAITNIPAKLPKTKQCRAFLD
jgi:hypothetical protein